MTLDDFESDPHVVRAMALTDLGELAAAMEVLELADASNPVFPRAWNNLGAAWMAKGDHSRAESCFGRALERSPDFLVGCVNMGSCLVLQGRFADAAK
jgi:Flp pilus assembly protein TadD